MDMVIEDDCHKSSLFEIYKINWFQVPKELNSAAFSSAKTSQYSIC